MALISVVLILLGSLFIVLSLGYIFGAASKWWTGFGVPLGLIGLTTGSIGLLALLGTGFLGTHPLSANVESFLVYLVPVFSALYAVFWFLFVSRYLGLLTASNEVVLGIVTTPILVAMPLGTTWTMQADAVAEPIRLLTALPSWLLQTSAYFVAPLHFGIAVVGIVALLWGVNQYPTPTASFGSKLVLAGPIWYFTIYSGAPVLGLQNELFHWLTAASGVISLGGIWLVAASGNLIDHRPTTNIIGRNTVIEALDHPVLVLDTEGLITDSNRKATETFSRPKTALTHASIEDIVPPEAAREIQEGTEEVSVQLDNRHYEISISTVSSGRGAYLGRTLVFRDVTERERREQRIEVLNRILRHNLRNEGTAIMGFSNLMEAQETYDEEYMSKISERIETLVETGQRAQEIDRMMDAAQGASSPTPLERIIEQSVARLEAGEDLDVEIDVPDYLRLRTPDRILVPMIAEALRNAVTHGKDQNPKVLARMDDDHSTEYLLVSVEDSGPGIPDQEVNVIRKGEEDALEHGSGLGLWLLRWGATEIGGSISIEGRDPTGTRVTIAIPAAQITGPGTEVPETPTEAVE